MPAAIATRRPHARFTGLVAALAVAALGLLAGPPAAQAGECGSWNDTMEYRCLSQGAAAFAGETLRLTAKTDQPQVFQVQQWFSRCGLPSALPPTPALVLVLAPGQTLDIKLQGYPMVAPPDAESYCAEAFVFGCDGGRGSCITRMAAMLSPQAKQQARACEPWGDDGRQIRCLSRADAAERGETVTFKNRSTEQIHFEFEQWQSQCGFLGEKVGTLETRWLDAGATTTVRLFQNSKWSTLNPDGERCTELFVTSCTDTNAFRRCADLLQTTISE